jgi:flagellum-specific peptidoglycan hydrolase FlgJ
MKIKSYHIVILISILAFSCGPKKGIVTKKKKEDNKTENVVINDNTTDSEVADNTNNTVKTTKPPSSTENYISKYAPIAKAEMRKSRIPASITLAQGILESGSGRGRLAVEANNHFGIKCHGWKGQKIYHDDDASQECFRKYRKAESSYEDHSEFLTGRKRYSKLFKLKSNDYKGWARGLKAAGYATDRKYPQKLISLIERYKLYNYDKEVLNNDAPDIVRVNAGIIRYTIEKGDTLYALAKRYNTSVERIKDLNNMTSNDLVIGEEIMIPN